MNILIIGSGAREHAIAWKLSQSRKVKKIFISPGNGGTAEKFTNVKLDLAEPFDEVVDFIGKNDIELTVIGPEDPLVAGMADRLEGSGFKVFGPCKAAALLEGSKAFAKEIMNAAKVPTAAHKVFTNEASARAYLETKKGPVVLKADGLAAGKGVIVCKDCDEALTCLGVYFRDKKFGSAGSTLVIEDFLKGKEASILIFSDGKTLRALTPSQDHKRAFDNDEGPNTGGMGVYSPLNFFTPRHLEFVMERIARPVIETLRRRGIVYKGILYAGLMIDGDDIQVVEFNVRFGDPETECVLPLLKSDLAQIMLACAEGKLDEVPFELKRGASVTVVMASGGYPEAYEKGKEIMGLDKVKDCLVFHAGTKNDNGKILTTRGRVLTVTAVEGTLEKAIEKAYAEMEKISFEKGFYRKDIGKKGLGV